MVQAPGRSDHWTIRIPRRLVAAIVTRRWAGRDGVHVDRLRVPTAEDDILTKVMMMVNCFAVIRVVSGLY